MNQSDVSQSSQQSEDSSETAQLMNSFGETLQNKLNQVESMQKNAQTKMQKFAAGEIENVHDVSISLQKAQMGLNTASAVRRKVLQAFDELQQMG
ncbi:MAG: flagellar hook-basal body complex protein FliE [bacterium]